MPTECVKLLWAQACPWLGGEADQALLTRPHGRVQVGWFTALLEKGAEGKAILLVGGTGDGPGYHVG